MSQEKRSLSRNEEFHRAIYYKIGLCKTCGGSGRITNRTLTDKIITFICSDCRGSGKIKREVEL